ncbi:ATP F0F1 synthase subunit I [Vibrio sp. 10N.286.49.C2]|uniref:F0F1 ATP synthase subunit I n=1 Tax=Vibrio qingdaonensis TaxID=2829491 RepID=A0A9X3CSX7_9VIBR|nr:MULTISPECIES: F0F1 ATP synthase subunit I [Vibrio]MCW8348264.1 F0F1 ATP synthase subunit I [Vibrio qingdaonensis]PMH36536.1 ATP F0F1 synthase subunit I [Vibrio sp. 10N.286.49.C2]PMH52441.1 ATP F0F1 synthase subunit I [Vibrio sp. 10N.286.49.B1]PMH81915.1 ATP F0F1 synthase subunit I [Vibrio sp. 10N.286.48.B7]
MVAVLAKPGRELAKRLLLIQVCAVTFVAVGMTVAVNAEWGISALIGGGIFVIANATFAFCAFLFSGARAAQKVAASFYAGAALKILITAALFSIAYMYIQVEVLPLNFTFLLALLINLMAPVIVVNNKK